MESVYELMVGQTLDHHTSVSISVNRSGNYCVIIFAIIKGEILDENPSSLVELEVEIYQG